MAQTENGIEREIKNKQFQFEIWFFGIFSDVVINDAVASYTTVFNGSTSPELLSLNQKYKTNFYENIRNEYVFVNAKLFKVSLKSEIHCNALCHAHFYCICYCFLIWLCSFFSFFFKEKNKQTNKLNECVKLSKLMIVAIAAAAVTTNNQVSCASLSFDYKSEKYHKNKRMIKWSKHAKWSKCSICAQTKCHNM